MYDRFFGSACTDAHQTQPFSAVRTVSRAGSGLGNKVTSFKTTCLNSRFTSRRNDPYGVISRHGEIPCFNRCGGTIAFDRLGNLSLRVVCSCTYFAQLIHVLCPAVEGVLDRESLGQYEEQLTSTVLRRDPTTTWCQCGTVYSREDGRQRGDLYPCLGNAPSRMYELIFRSHFSVGV